MIGIKKIIFPPLIIIKIDCNTNTNDSLAPVSRVNKSKFQNEKNIP